MSRDRQGAVPDAENRSLTVAAPSDAPTLAALVNKAFLVEQEFVHGDRTNESQISAMMQTGIFYLTEGACVFVRVTGKRGYFGMLSVDPAQQGRGLGRKLVEVAEDHCRKAGCEWMDITVLNLRLELPPFYHRLGYVQTGTKPFSEPARAKAPCHFMVMSKPLGL